MTDAELIAAWKEQRIGPGEPSFRQCRITEPHNPHWYGDDYLCRGVTATATPPIRTTDRTPPTDARYLDPQALAFWLAHTFDSMAGTLDSLTVARLIEQATHEGATNPARMVEARVPRSGMSDSPTAAIRAVMPTHFAGPLTANQTHADDANIPPTLAELADLARAFLTLDARYDDLTPECAAAKVALRVAVEAVTV